MRIMAGSSCVLMAPQRKNKWTCTIEVLTSMNVPKDEWINFITELNKRWLYNPLIKQKEYKGNYCRPHWAKEWDTMTIKNMPAIEYVKNVYSKEISTFRYTKKKLDLDPINMFSNELFDKIFDTKFSPSIFIEHEKKANCPCCFIC